MPSSECVCCQQDHPKDGAVAVEEDVWCFQCRKEGCTLPRLSKKPLFAIGDHVEFRAGRDLHGIVTAILQRSGGHLSFEVTWFHDGKAECRWCDAVELIEYDPNANRTIQISLPGPGKEMKP